MKNGGRIGEMEEILGEEDQRASGLPWTLSTRLLPIPLSYFSLIYPRKMFGA